MDIGTIVSNENIEQLKGVISTLIAFGGLDIITGMISISKIERVSLIIDAVIKMLKSVSFVSNGTINVLKKVQDYGNDKI